MARRGRKLLGKQREARNSRGALLFLTAISKKNNRKPREATVKSSDKRREEREELTGMDADGMRRVEADEGEAGRGAASAASAEKQKYICRHI